MPSPDELYIGLMSGTSLDGIDAVLVDLGGPSPHLLAAHTFPFPPGLQAELLALCAAGIDEIERLGRSDRHLGEALARATLALLDSAGVNPSQVRAIGSHGQTIRHRPAGADGFTLQIGDPATLAERTGIATVADFRRRDIAAGGQGAPLVPAFHAALFGGDEARVIVNIGGMANLTLVAPNAPLLGYDSGPGNVLLDAWIRQHHDQPFDRNGAWAATGQCHGELLAALCSEPYFALGWPKSTGRELFDLSWLERHLATLPTPPAPADVQATLAELTATTVAQAIRALPVSIDSVFVCGGGAYNAHLLARLQAQLGPASLTTTAVLGVAPEWVEAIAFAWLAQRTLLGLPGNAPSVTGATRPCILGAIHPAG